MTIFRYDIFLSVAAICVLAYVLWWLATGLSSGTTRFAGMTITRDEQPIAFVSLMTFLGFAALIEVMIVLGLAFGIETRFWL